MSGVAEALAGGINAFVGGGQRHPHVLRARGTIEVAWSGQDAAGGKPVDRIPARFAAGRPQKERTFGVRDGEARRLECPTQSYSSRQIHLALRRDVRVIAQGHPHRFLHGPRHHQPKVLAYLEEFVDHRLVAGDEGRTVAGEVRPLRQRVHSEQSVEAVAADVRMQDRPRLALPREFEITLVGDEEYASFARPIDRLLEMLWAQDASGRVGRRIDEEDLRRDGADADGRIACNDGRSDETCADLIRGIGEFGDDYRVARADAELHRQARDEFLGADGWEYGVRAETGDAEFAVQPIDGGLPHGGSAIPVSYT